MLALRRTITLACITLLLAFASCVECFAGTSGGMSGYVRNAMGKPVANVLVTAVSPSETCTTHTDRHGFFVCLTLPPDLYSVWAKKIGTSNAYAFVRIHSDQTTFLDFSIDKYLRNCPEFTQAPLAAAPFTSLDVKLMEAFPPNVAPRRPLPMAIFHRVYGCL